MNFIKATLATTLLISLVGCRAPKNVTYLEEAETIPNELLQNDNSRLNPVLSPGDLLNIKVFAPNMASVAQFNKGMIVTSEGGITVANPYNANTLNNKLEASTDYYLINSDGNIDFPVFGNIKAAGKTKEEIAEEIRSLIYPKYVTTPPTVDVRLMNFKVTVLGAVKNPGVVTSDNERLNILEALARAGDLDIKGQRDNILLYRTEPDGSHKVERLNLNDKNLLLSPYFNLQQNDFIYVEPNRSAKQNAWQMNPAWAATITFVGGISSLASLIIGIINLSK